MTEQADRIVQTLIEIGRTHDKTPSLVAIRWILDHSEISSVIIGPDTPEQVDDVLGALGWSLTLDEQAMLDELSKVERPQKFA